MGKSNSRPKVVLVEQVGRSGENSRKKEFKKRFEEMTKNAGMAFSARLLFFSNGPAVKRHLRGSDIVVVHNNMLELRREIARRDAENNPLFTGELIFSHELDDDLCAKLVRSLKHMCQPIPLNAMA